ncbi:methionine ABC transporter ATP-binding protein [Oerskovia jenensis]|uniref:D-methionine transport system ATP-binding protein n=1 Tax=Oerskovia jenensis TaxID=162169 RepID=A0ABS2LG51_9CELL|nr:ATP-binding cassette domain-containing protein [Oerskovia jenensis]MBM7478814.1 D-methionine transport system ATP-binding protein [Oerskovia jenensis]
MISYRNVDKTFHVHGDEVHALDDVSFDVATGGVQGIIGFSGAGKSTLLRTTNLLERPDAGTVSVDGVDITALDRRGLREFRRSIGMVFQHFNLLAQATVHDNVGFALEVAGVPRRARRRRIEECLAILDIEDKARDYPASLSGGQKQRVGIARALANSPRVLLCDEPTSAVDPETTGTILSYLQRVNVELGITIVLVTHEMNVVRAICDDVVVMEAGRVVERFDPRVEDHLPTSRIGRFLVDDRIRLDGTRAVEGVRV